MKIRVEKDPFLKGWLIAERCAATSDALPVLTGILCNFKKNQITMEATDLKTSVRWSVVSSFEDLTNSISLLLPAKTAGELFRKIPGNFFTLEIGDGKATLQSEKSKYRFSTFPVESFPKLNSSEGTTFLGSCSVETLRRMLERGTFAGSLNEEFPQFLAGASFDIREERITVATTDTRRLALERGTLDRQDRSAYQIVLPVRGLRELQRILGSCDPGTEVLLAVDDAQTFFVFPGGEFSIRRLDVKFPPYENLVNIEGATGITLDKSALMEALERLDVVVRNHTRVVVLDISDSEGCRMTGQAPDVGTATETVEADVVGSPLRVAFNARFLLEGLKAMEGSQARLTFNGPLGHLLLSCPEHPEYAYILMPVTLAEDDRRMADENSGDSFEEHAL